MMNRLKKEFINRRSLAFVLFFIFIVILLVCAFSKEKVHTYRSVVTRHGDCVTPGLRTYKCVRCSYKRTEPIVGGHTYADTLVIPVSGKNYIARRCTVCGNEIVDDDRDISEENQYSLVSAGVSGVEKVYKHTGEAIFPVPVVEDRNNNPLTENVDYTVKVAHNVEVGTASVIIQGTGSYYNSCEVQFDIADMYWEEKDGSRYYYENGQLAGGLKDIDGEGYFFNEEGIMQTGWQEIDGRFYCFDRLTGVLAKNTQVDGINVDESGRAEESDYNQYKIETMMKAHQIMLEQTAPTDSMEDKRLKLFNWEMYEHEYHRWRLLSDIYDSSPDWEITFANDIFDNGSGCCVADACAAAFLFREIGYTDIYVCHDTSHCWFTVGGKLYDPLFAESKSFEDNYNAEFTDYRSNPAGRRRIDGPGITEDSDE